MTERQRQFGGNRFVVLMRHAAVGAISLAFLGCTPVSGTYYEPSGPGVVVDEGGACNLNLDKGMLIKLFGGASLLVTAFPAGRSGARTSLDVSILLRTRQRARFESPLILISAPTLSKVWRLPLGYGRSDLSYPGAKDTDIQQPTDTMDGGWTCDRRYKCQGLYTFSVVLPLETSGEFTVILPALLLDTERVPIAPIQFSLMRRGKVFGLTCAV